MPSKLPAFLSTLPPSPEHHPVRDAIARNADPETTIALRLFESMPPSTAVLANPVRYHRALACGDNSIEAAIRSFAFRGCLLEEDIVFGSADAARVIFVGLFGRFARSDEHQVFSRLLARELESALIRVLPPVAALMKAFPECPSDVAMQHVSALRKAAGDESGVNTSRPPVDVLLSLIRIHLENAAAGASASCMRRLLKCRRSVTANMLVRETENLIQPARRGDPFGNVFNLLLGRLSSSTEAMILQNLGAIQIHHGSAGSNMVARYFASLHTRSVSDLFTASQMALDCARHFGAITDLTEFVARLEGEPPLRRDSLIRERAAKGSLPAFGHPEIAAAGRGHEIEVDPRPAIYLSPLFEAIDSGAVVIPGKRLKRIEIAQRIYQLAFVEGLEKPGRIGRLRVAPNTDFGAWIVQEALGIDERDRTLLSYVFRGFGWMMDVREQLQQPIIRPVIPPDPNIVPPPAGDGIISDVVETVHNRLCGSNAFGVR